MGGALLRRCWWQASPFLRNMLTWHQQLPFPSVRESTYGRTTTSPVPRILSSSRHVRSTGASVYREGDLPSFGLALWHYRS
jgi:hypothetical protein